MSRVQLALYRGPGTTWPHKLAHIVTCAVLTLRCLDRCPYSHAELVIDGRCHSSSARDGGVRSKTIDLATGRWDVFYLPGIDADAALRRFAEREGRGYDWPGALRWGLPFLRQRPARTTALRWWPTCWVCHSPAPGHRWTCWPIFTTHGRPT